MPSSVLLSSSVWLLFSLLVCSALAIVANDLSGCWVVQDNKNKPYPLTEVFFYFSGNQLVGAPGAYFLQPGDPVMEPGGEVEYGMFDDASQTLSYKSNVLVEFGPLPVPVSAEFVISNITATTFSGRKKYTLALATTNAAVYGFRLPQPNYAYQWCNPNVAVSFITTTPTMSATTPPSAAPSAAPSSPSLAPTVATTTMPAIIYVDSSPTNGGAGIPGGLIAGVLAAVVVFLLIIGIVVYCLMRQKKRSDSFNEKLDYPESTKKITYEQFPTDADRVERSGYVGIETHKKSQYDRVSDTQQYDHVPDTTEIDAAVTAAPVSGYTNGGLELKTSQYEGTQAKLEF